MQPTQLIRPRHLPVLLLAVSVLAGCSRVSSSTSTSSPRGMPSFELRQFDPASPFFHDAPYPDEILSIQDADVLALSCSPDYFSWTGANHEVVDPVSGETVPIRDLQLQSYLDSAIRLLPDGTIVSISLCSPLEGPDLVLFRAGPCGGGCAGIPHVALGQRDGTLTLVGEIRPDGDGAYFACSALLLTTGRQLYLACHGEGTGIIRRLDLSSGNLSVVLRCEQTPDHISCQS